MRKPYALLLIFFIGLFSVYGILNASQTSEVFEIHESFENEDWYANWITPDNHSYYFERSSDSQYVVDGDHSLKTQNGIDGGPDYKYFLTNVSNITNGDIEGWYYSKGSVYHVFFLGLRVTEGCRNHLYDPSCSGYFLRIYKEHASIVRLDAGIYKLLIFDLFGYTIENYGWFLKFQASDNILNAWVTHDGNFKIEPFLSYNISSDETIYTVGSAAFGGRILVDYSPYYYYLFIDDIKIYNVEFSNKH